MRIKKVVWEHPWSQPLITATICDEFYEIGINYSINSFIARIMFS